MAMGRNLVEGQDDPTAGHPSFFPTFFGAQLASPDYHLLGQCPRRRGLHARSPRSTRRGRCSAYSIPASSPTTCWVNTAVAGAQAGSYYENYGTGGPYVANVYTPEGGARSVRTLVEGQTLGSIGSRYLLRTGGTHNHYLNLFSNLFATLNCGSMAAPVGVGDGPGSGPTSELMQFMSLRSSNPMRAGEARITFALSRTEKAALKVYDVSGRLVKTVTQGIFSEGEEHVVVWDGTDDQGTHVRNRVYFSPASDPDVREPEEAHRHHQLRERPLASPWDDRDRTCGRPNFRFRRSRSPSTSARRQSPRHERILAPHDSDEPAADASGAFLRVTVMSNEYVPAAALSGERLISC